MSPTAMLDELALYLRPPGQGIYTVSTGRAERAAATMRYLGWHAPQSWRTHLEQILTEGTRPAVALIAVPSDTGAGIVRGASHGPEAIRERLGRAPVPDLGDVFCIPQLLDDEMCSQAQLDRSREFLYPHVDPHFRTLLPVCPLSLTERVWQLVHTLAPGLRLLLLGGDHTVVWPAVKVLVPASNEPMGIVHFDAHTDLLPHRLGVRYCFATWAYHANLLLGGEGRMLQIGIRASAQTQRHWQQTTGVRQIWADEALSLGSERLAERVVAHLHERGIRRVYVSNDLDGTDARWAAACGTPEPGGLTPAMVTSVLEALGREAFQVVGADVVELAPGLSLDARLAGIACETATAYVHAALALLGNA